MTDENSQHDPWWAKYWYTSALVLALWMLVAIYGAVTYDLKLESAIVHVRQASESRLPGPTIVQIELWLVTLLVPLSLLFAAFFVWKLTGKKKSQ